MLLACRLLPDCGRVAALSRTVEMGQQQTCLQRHGPGLMRIGKHNGRSLVRARRLSAVNLLRAARDRQPPSSRTAARVAPIARRRLRLPMPIVRILLVLLALASPLSMAG